MAERDHKHNKGTVQESFWRSRSGVVFGAFLAIAGLLLAYEHRIHIFTGNGFLIALLLGCVVMHLFMHGGHGNHNDHGGGHRHNSLPNDEKD